MLPAPRRVPPLVKSLTPRLRPFAESSTASTFSSALSPPRLAALCCPGVSHYVIIGAGSAGGSSGRPPVRGSAHHDHSAGGRPARLPAGHPYSGSLQPAFQIGCRLVLLHRRSASVERSQTLLAARPDARWIQFHERHDLDPRQSARLRRLARRRRHRLVLGLCRPRL